MTSHWSLFITLCFHKATSAFNLLILHFLLVLHSNIWRLMSRPVLLAGISIRWDEDGHMIALHEDDSIFLTCFIPCHLLLLLAIIDCLAADFCRSILALLAFGLLVAHQVGQFGDFCVASLSIVCVLDTHVENLTRDIWSWHFMPQ